MPLSVGTQHGPYEILAAIGAGGMGEVYKARDTRLNRLVALKVLPADCMADQQRRQRFIQEAQLASALQHPNIVTIYGIECLDGVDSISMELVNGRALDEVLQGKGLPVAEALKYAVQIADALATAHAAGIVHRDLKPGNIMITGQGAVKVLDFGLAKLTAAADIGDLDETRTQLAEVRTEAGMILGSVGYMSPEQAEGKNADARSDIFSFGAILYEMLTGQRAFGGESKMSRLAAVMNLEPSPISQIAPAVPRELERWVSRCLRKDPDKRAQHMADIKLALEELKQDSISGTLDAGAAASVKRSPRRRIWQLMALGIAALAAAGWWWRSDTPSVAFEPTLLTTYPGSEAQPSFSPDGSQVAFVWKGEGRDSQANIYVKLIGGGPPLRLTLDAGAHYFPAWSPDGKSIAYWAVHTDGRQGIYLIPPLGGPEQLLVEGAGAGRLDWSPDGKWIASSPGSGMILVAAGSGERRELAKLNPALTGGYYATFSPDGSRLAYMGQRGDYAGAVYVVGLSADMKPQGQPKRLTFGERGATYPTWTSDGREVVFMEGSETSNGAIARVAVDGKGRSRRVPGVGYSTGLVAIARTGNRMAYASGGVDDDIWRLDLSGREPPRKLIASSLYETAAEYSPDGKRIVFSSNRSGPRELWICYSDGENCVQLTHFGGPVTGTPRWSPDGRRIAFDSRPGDNADIYVIGAEGGTPRRLTVEPGEDARPGWSADGKWIYFSSDRSGSQQIWRVPADGGEATQISKNGGFEVLPARNGEWLYYKRKGTSNGPLHRMRLDGSDDTEIIPIASGLRFAVTATGVYFVTFKSEGSVVQTLRFSTGAIRELVKLDHYVGLGLSISPDERYALVTKPDQKGTDLMLVENFH
jgi:eukaryotic-like serine/threonine-protein kinase